jgi:hypothetical protein
VATPTGRRHDHHPPWSPPSPRTASTRPVWPARAEACSPATASPPATDAPHAGLACLVAQRTRAAAAARPQPRPRSATDPPTDNRVTSAASPESRAPRPSTRPPDGAAATAAPTRCCGAGSPGRLDLVPTPPPEVGGDGRDRTDRGGQQTAGHRRGGQQTGWTADGVDTGRVTAAGRIAGPGTMNPGDRTPDGRTPYGRTPVGWTAGSRTTNRLGGHRMLDTGDRRHGGVLAVSTTATTPDAGCPLAAPPGRRRLGEQQPGLLSSTDDEGIMLLWTGLATAATVNCRWYAAVQVAPRRTALVGKGWVESRAARWWPSGIRQRVGELLVALVR